MKANGEDREYFMVRIQHKRDGDGNSRRGTPLENPLFTTNVKKKEVKSLYGHLNLCNSKGKNPGQQP